MQSVYTIAGISRQGYHQQLHRQADKALLHCRLKELVQELRGDHPRIGARKLFTMLKLKGEIGINKFERFLSEQGLGIKTKRSAQRTTNSTHPFYKYRNLLHGFEVTNINQVWASDITYFMVGENVYYIIFIQDVYSRRILGYSVSDNMLHHNNVKVLEDSIALRSGADLGKLIHHSDKGGQYCATNYIRLLNENNIAISMAGNSIENPYVERLNGIIKNEYLYPRKKATDLKSLKKEMDIIVKLYNESRPHLKLGNLSPVEFEGKLVEKQKENTDKLTLFNFEKHQEERFLEALTKRMNGGKLPTQNNMVGNDHSHRTSYSLESCSSAELSSASLDETNFVI
ncbi:MAG: IS3 family transposase [Chloroflexia bacterium]|nr:IS3 family transposase [Chloroflexia bacterium]